MNFTASIKYIVLKIDRSARIKPNCVLNVSIDIPLKSTKILSNRSHMGEFHFSPKRVNLNKKLKMTANTANFSKTARDGDSRKVSSCLGDTLNTTTFLKKKTIQSNGSQNKRDKLKNRSCEVSPKHKMFKGGKKKSSISNKMLNRYINESEDNIIKYTNQSAEFKGKNVYAEAINAVKEEKLYPNEEKHEENVSQIDVSEIRSYQKIATERKQHLNYLYLKQKVLVLASVKKIQRAWRNYKTKKLLKSYSHQASLKYTNKMKSSLNSPSILTVRSSGNDLRIEKKELEEPKDPVLDEDYEEKRNEVKKMAKKKKSLRSEKLKSFQMEEIRKWEDLINQIRTGKKLEDVLQNSFKRKKQLEQDLEKNEKSLSNLQQSSENSSDSRRGQKKYKKHHEEIMNTDERRKKLEFFQNQVRKIDNQNSDLNSVSQFDYPQCRSNNSQTPEELENQKLKKKLQIFNKLELLNESEEKTKKYKSKDIYEDSSQSLIDDISQNDHDKLETYRFENIQKSQKLKKSFKFTQNEREQLLDYFVDELIYEIFLEISEADRMVSKMKDFYQKSSKKKESLMEKKPEGICTNLQSVKDYLQNLVAYIFEQHPKLLDERLIKPCGPTAIMLFQYLRNQQTSEQMSSLIMPKDLFDEHWAFASEQIYFDAKYEDEEQEKERVTYLKNLTRIYFRSIFDAFNECLEPFRVYGLLGKPYPWKIQPLNIQTPEPRKTVRHAYRKLSTIAVVFCGLHLDDKKHTMSEQIIKSIQNERMNTLLQLQFTDEQYRWNIFDDEQAELLLKISEIIYEQTLKETVKDMFHIY